MRLVYFWIRVDKSSDQPQSNHQQGSYHHAVKQVKQVKDYTVRHFTVDLSDITDQRCNKELDANKRKHSPVYSIACPTSFNRTFVLTDSFPYDLFGTYRGVEVVIGESPQAQNL